MKYICIILGILGSLSSLSAQVIQERTVIGSAGAAPLSMGTLELSFTLGEAVIQAPIMADDTLSQGFWYQLTANQPVNIVKGTQVEGIEVFPNPTPDRVQIRTNQELSLAEVLDVRGRLWQKQLYPNGQVDLSALPEGVYILKLYVATDSQPAVFRITKY